MAGRTAYEALANFTSVYQLVASCVTHDVLKAPSGYRSLGDVVDLVLGSGEPVRLRGPGRIHLRARLRVRIEQVEPPRGLWDARLAAYEYRLSDRDDREIVAYHWHPESASHVLTPHLHLGPAAEVGHRALTTAHLPTGPVALGEVLRLAIDALGAEPIRRDWYRVLVGEA